VELLQIIEGLRSRKQKVERAIALLEELAEDQVDTPAMPLKRRGRKSMGPEERRKVSERIRKYWENRRDHKKTRREREPKAANEG
jgi:hypothetical protein